MKKITPLVFVFFFNNSYSCRMEISTNTNPPRLVNGEWIVTKKPVVKLPSINYKKLIENHSIVFSGIVEFGFTEEGKEIISYVYTDEIWKGSVRKSFEINKYKSNATVLDGYCGHGLINAHKYIFFAEIGTRKNPIRIFKAVGDDPEIRKYLKEPSKRWINGELFKK